MKFITSFYLLFLISPMIGYLGNVSSNLPSSKPKDNPARQVNRYDILITEILPDPSPSVGLAQVEFVELYNASDQAIDLSQLQFVNSNTRRNIPLHILAPQDYVLLADVDDTIALNIYGPTLGIPSFPALANTQDDLALIDQDGTIIHSLSYDQTWYQDGAKEDGGYTLEMINPFDACSGSENWAASTSVIGGTPAAVNSLDDESQINPFVLQSVVPGQEEIKLLFSKAVDIGTVESVKLSPPLDFQTILGESTFEVLLDLSESLLPGVEYTLSLENWIDCIGQSLSNPNAIFLLPEQPNSGDLLINEILFNPLVGGNDFIEVINASPKHISLDGLYLTTSEDPTDVQQITSGRVLKPEDIVVFTEDPNDIEARYTVARPENLLRQELPTLPDEEGNVTLYVVQETDALILDEFDYSADYHHALLRDQNGVSLERISTLTSTNDPSAWQSASETAGFATPTQTNSQIAVVGGEEQFELSPRVFSPDGDGVAEFLLLHYRFPAPGYISTVSVFDAAGRLVLDWVNQSSLGVSGSIKWDGTFEGGVKAPLGIYTVLLESFRENGNIIRWKETCVVANRLN